MAITQVTSGELLDRLVIDAVRKASNEGLRFVCATPPPEFRDPEILEFLKELTTIHQSLWELETLIRRMYKEGAGGCVIGALAYAISTLNDRRSELKSKINEMSGDVPTKKSYVF